MASSKQGQENSGGKFVVNPKALQKEARIIVKEVARGSGIDISQGAIDSLDKLMWLHSGEIYSLARRSGYDMDMWRSHVRHVSEQVVQHLQERRVRWILTPRKLEEYAGPVVKKHPY